MTAMAVPFAAALPLTIGGGSMPAALAAATVASPLIPPGPATVLHHGPTPWAMDDYLGGALCEAPKTCKEVRYDWIQPYGPIEIGAAENVARLDKEIHKKTDDPKIVYGYSGGARIASIWLQDHAGDKDAPAPQDLSFVLLGNGGRKYGGVNGWFWGDLLKTPTNTQYDIVDVAKEYDPIADFPTNPFNLLAVANGVAAFAYVHLRYDEVDLDDPDNIVWKEGKTTYVYVPTEHLPLLQGFYDAGMGDLVADLEPKLREIIDKAYDRSYLEGKPTQGELNGEAPTDDEAAAKPATTKRPLLDALLGRKTADTADKADATDEADADTGGTDATVVKTRKPLFGLRAPVDTEKSEIDKADTDKADTDKADTDKPDTKPGGKHRAPLFGSAKADKTDKTDKADKADKTDTTAKADKAEKTEKTDKTAKADTATKSAKAASSASDSDS
jgi:diacyltrehalose acyltransferase